MRVVDNSAVIAVLLGPEPAARTLEARLSKEEMAAPELIDIEALHTIRRLHRNGVLDETKAARAIDAFGGLGIERFPHRALLPRMWELRDNLTAYDAAYVALAELLGVALLTADARFAGAPGIRCAVELIS